MFNVIGSWNHHGRGIIKKRHVWYVCARNSIKPLMLKGMWEASVSISYDLMLSLSFRDQSFKIAPILRVSISIIPCWKLYLFCYSAWLPLRDLVRLYLERKTWNRGLWLNPTDSFQYLHVTALSFPEFARNSGLLLDTPL